MKRITGLLVLLMMALPSLAHAQFTHSSFFNGGTTLTATCTNATGTLASSDVFLGTAQGNTTVTLPTAATGCVDYDVIDLRFTAAASQAYTLTVSGGTGTVTKVPSNGGTVLVAPTGAASGAVNELHQIWVYNAVATTPQWELVTQEVVPAAGMNIGACTNLVSPYICTASNAIGIQASSDIKLQPFATLTADFGFSSIAFGNVPTFNLGNGMAVQSNGGTLPTVTGGCGSANVNAGSTNNRGSVTTGTTETSCQVVFSASGTWSNAPFCLCGDGGGDATPLGCSISGATTAHVTLTFLAATAKTFNYMCF